MHLSLPPKREGRFLPSGDFNRQMGRQLGLPG